MSSLECIYLPLEQRLKDDKDYPFKLDIAALKHYVDEKSQEDWNKAAKSFGNDGIGFAKSTFHALRTLDFARQIIRNGKIIDYSSRNEDWKDLAIYNNGGFLWTDYTKDYYDGEYQLLRNELGL